jgi:hypothetical protein
MASLANGCSESFGQLLCPAVVALPTTAASLPSSSLLGFAALVPPLLSPPSPLTSLPHPSITRRILHIDLIVIFLSVSLSGGASSNAAMAALSLSS